MNIHRGKKLVRSNLEVFKGGRKESNNIGGIGNNETVRVKGLGNETTE